MLEFEDVPPLRDPVLVAAFEGWNDAGEAASAAVEQVRAGKPQTFGFLVGQVMKQSGGKANPKVVNQLLRREIEKGQ